MSCTNCTAWYMRALQQIAGSLMTSFRSNLSLSLMQAVHYVKLKYSVTEERFHQDNCSQLTLKHTHEHDKYFFGSNLEVAQEQLWFASLDFSILYRRSAEWIVKLDGLVCCNTLFVLRRFTSQPKMYRSVQRATKMARNEKKFSICQWEEIIYKIKKTSFFAWFICSIFR